MPRMQYILELDYPFGTSRQDLRVHIASAVRACNGVKLTNVTLRIPKGSKFNMRPELRKTNKGVPNYG